METDAMSAEELWMRSFIRQASVWKGLLGREALDGTGSNQVVCGYMSSQPILAFLGTWS